MNATLIQMPTHVARHKFLEYKRSIEQRRKLALAEAAKQIESATTDKKRERLKQSEISLRARLSEEDKVLMAGYRALSQGKRILNINQIMQEAGTDQHGRPRLAISRADQRFVYCNSGVNWKRINGIRSRFECITFSPNEFNFVDERETTLTHRFARKIFPSFAGSTNTPNNFRAFQSSLRSPLPIVPLAYRPHDSLSKYHLLWDVVWDPQPPVDPILLAHLREPLYAIVAQWDLTPLERSILF